MHEPIEVEEKLYWSETELIQMLAGLAVVYFDLPWILKLYYKPYMTALKAMQVALIGNKLQEEVEKEELFKSIGSHLTDQ